MVVCEVPATAREFASSSGPLLHHHLPGRHKELGPQGATGHPAREYLMGGGARHHGRRTLGGGKADGRIFTLVARQWRAEQQGDRTSARGFSRRVVP
ncbi:hypothetical protein ACRAWF_35595 [Streptomyces sp. L7]